jgi:hypothetical protein
MASRPIRIVPLHPGPALGAHDDPNGEIGDICAWQTKTLGPWTVQLEWSNQDNACV